MKYFLYTLLMLLSLKAGAQINGNFSRVTVRDSIWLNGIWIKGICQTLDSASNKIASTAAIKSALNGVKSEFKDSLSSHPSFNNLLTPGGASIDYTNIATPPWINNNQKGAVNGVATLDGSGKVPGSQIPAIAISETFPVNSEADMLALPAETGDVSIRSDVSKSFILQASPASTLALESFYQMLRK